MKVLTDSRAIAHRHSKPALPDLFPFVSLILVAWTLGGCATSRGVIDVQPQVVAAPAVGQMVSLSTVEDRRKFERAPGDPSIPSLKDRRIDDIGITSRAIARKRNSYGKALGDVLLPEGRTVSDIAREAFTSALHDRGYRVVDPSATGRPDVSGLRVEILEFWAWFTPGFWAAHLECRIHLRVTEKTDPSAGSREFRGYVRLATQAATGAAWKKTIDKAIESLMKDTESQLAARPIGARADASTTGSESAPGSR